MTTQHLHIVAFDVPLPPNYGGVIDLYNRLKAIKENGVTIHLHCFEYGRGRNHDYSEIASEIFYYDLNKRFIDYFFLEPKSIRNRRNNQLIDRLAQDRYPILIEGQQIAYLLEEKRLEDRAIFVRLNSIEWKYYHKLIVTSPSPFKKIKFGIESLKFRFNEKILAKAKALFPLSNNDVAYYKKIHPSTHYWHAGFNFSSKKFAHVTIKDQCLFHGNLSVEENEKIALFLIRFWKKRKISKKLIIAGRDPSERIFSAKLKAKNIEIISSPSDELMNEIIQESKYNLMMSLEAMGIKIKLLNSLVLGNICVSNTLMIQGTGLEKFCEVFENEDELEAIIYSETISFDKAERTQYIQSYLNPNAEAKKILDMIFNR